MCMWRVCMLGSLPLFQHDTWYCRCGGRKFKKRHSEHITMGTPFITAPISCVQSQLAKWDLAFYEHWVMLRHNRRWLQFISYSCSVKEEGYSTKNILRVLMYASNSMTPFKASRSTGCLCNLLVEKPPAWHKLCFISLSCTTRSTYEQKTFHWGNQWSCLQLHKPIMAHDSNSEACDEAESVTQWALIREYFLECANSEHLVDTNTHRQTNRNRHSNRCRLCLTIKHIHPVQ